MPSYNFSLLRLDRLIAISSVANYRYTYGGAVYGFASCPTAHCDILRCLIFCTVLLEAVASSSIPQSELTKGQEVAFETFSPVPLSWRDIARNGSWLAERFHACSRFLSITKEVLSLLSNRRRSVKRIAESNAELPADVVAVVRRENRWTTIPTSPHFPIHL